MWNFDALDLFAFAFADVDRCGGSLVDIDVSFFVGFSEVDFSLTGVALRLPPVVYFHSPQR